MRHPLFSAVPALLAGLLAAAPAALTEDALPKGDCKAPAPRTDLRHCNFEGAMLMGADLSGADVRGVKFAKARMTGCAMRGARAGGANFRWTDMKGCDLSGADFSGSDMLHVRLDSAKVDGTDFTKAYLFGAILSHAHGEKAVFDTAHLRDVEIDSATLPGANFSAATLFRGFIIDSDMRGAKFDKAEMTGLSIEGSDLSGARFRKANMAGMNIISTKLKGAEGNPCRGPCILREIATLPAGSLVGYGLRPLLHGVVGHGHGSLHEGDDELPAHVGHPHGARTHRQHARLGQLHAEAEDDVLRRLDVVGDLAVDAPRMGVVVECGDIGHLGMLVDLPLEKVQNLVHGAEGRFVLGEFP